MADLLRALGNNPTARKAIRTLGLPVPLPEPLRRSQGPELERPLAGRNFVVLSPELGRGEGLAGAAVATIARAGGAVGRETAAGAATATMAADGIDGFVVDAGELAQPADLRMLYDALHGRINALRRCGRVVVLARPPEGTREPLRSAARAGAEGFVRSLGKEIGRRGATANILYVADGADDRLGAPLRFVLSDRAAFVSGQPLMVGHLVRGDVSDPIAGALLGKTAMVTGAARGIGAAIVARLAEEGAKVVAVDVPGAAEATEAVASRWGGVALHADLTADGAIAGLLEGLGARGLRLDVLVNNAGITRDRTLAKMPPAHWDQCVAVNLDAAARLTDAALAAGRLDPRGRVVCLASIGGIGGNPGQTNYAAAKRALMAYVAALAQRMARDGGAAMAVAPGFIETPMTAAMPALVREAARRLNSLGQGGEPQDVADAVMFLASPGAIGLAGATLRVCGQHLSGA